MILTNYSGISYGVFVYELFILIEMQLLLFLSPCLNYSNGSEQSIEQQASSSMKVHIIQISGESMKQNKDVDRAQSDDMAILQVQH